MSIDGCPHGPWTDGPCAECLAERSEAQEDAAVVAARVEEMKKKLEGARVVDMMDATHEQLVAALRSAMRGEGKLEQ
jgi:hypothetical protein